MAFPRLELHPIIATAAVRVHMLSIEQHVVTRRSSSGRRNERMLNLISGPVVPVGDGEDPQVHIVRQRCRPIDLDGSNNTVGVLGREM